MQPWLILFSASHQSKNTGSVVALTQTTDQSVLHQCDRMELRPLRVMILLISLIRVGQAQEKPKPTVRVSPQSSVYTGDRVTLNCNLLSNGWTFLWYKDRVQVAEDTNTLHDTVSNAGETVYQCNARRGNYDSELSDPVTVTVRALPKPVVSINPDEQVYRGETVTFRCDLQDEEDSDWIYSWNKDGSGVSSEQEYRISSAETSHAGKYTCRGRERGGSHSSHTSDAVTLTVSEKPKPELTPSREGAVLKGNSVTLSCTLKLQSAGWKFYWIKPTQSTETETETDYYNISSVRDSDGGQYRCRAGRGNPVYYTHYSDAFWVNVTGAGEKGNMNQARNTDRGKAPASAERSRL